jgi:hypothetical protein
MRPASICFPVGFDLLRSDVMLERTIRDRSASASPRVVTTVTIPFPLNLLSSLKRCGSTPAPIGHRHHTVL